MIDWRVKHHLEWVQRVILGLKAKSRSTRNPLVADRVTSFVLVNFVQRLTNVSFAQNTPPSYRYRQGPCSQMQSYQILSFICSMWLAGLSSIPRLDSHTASLRDRRPGLPIRKSRPQRPVLRRTCSPLVSLSRDLCTLSRGCSDIDDRARSDGATSGRKASVGGAMRMRLTDGQPSSSVLWRCFYRSSYLQESVGLFCTYVFDSCRRC